MPSTKRSAQAAHGDVASGRQAKRSRAGAAAQPESAVTGTASAATDHHVTTTTSGRDGDHRVAGAGAGAGAGSSGCVLPPSKVSTVRSDPHVLTVRFDKADESPVPAFEPDTLLAACLHPLPVDDFMASSFRKRPVAIVGGDATRFAGMCSEHMCDLDLEALLETNPSPDIHVWIRSTAEHGRINTVKVTEAGDAVKLYEAGASLYSLGSQEFAQEYCTALTRDLGIGHAGTYASGEVRGEIEVFASRAGHITEGHFDFQENFTLQLCGTKKWFLKQSTVTHPLRGCTPHYKGSGNVEEQLKVHRMQDRSFKFQSPELVEGAAEVVTLGPGDVLYHPAGVWHRVEAVTDSLSINFSLVGSTWADITADAVRQLLWRDSRFRAIFRATSPADARAQLASMLPALCESVGALTAADILPDGQSLPAGSVLRLSDVADEAPVPRGTRLRQNPLAALLRVSDTAMARDVGAEDEDMACDSDDDGLAGAHGGSVAGGCDAEEGDVEAESHDHAAGDDCGSTGSSDSGSLPENHTGYIVHLNYGNDDLQSRMRLDLHIPNKLTAGMEWLLERWGSSEPFTCDALLPTPVAGGDSTSWQLIALLLRAGVVTRCDAP